MVKPLMLVPVAVFAGFAGLALVGMLRDDPNALPSAREGQQAPPVVLTQLGAETPFTDADLRSEGVKLVNFWASWCAPCRAEHPTLMQLAEEGLPVYGINYKEPSSQDALDFLTELGDPYTQIGADITGRDTAVEWGVYGIPETYVIDGSGTIILRFAGPVTQRVLTDTLRPALEKAASN
ncbi:DsbE family thiol:disulfide interchange protein [Algirhabdus cladophorae]|uniref:DsbE family thiol:disulfide interchange protein n=1 Tax=Algirhabdus cladophorae TaxID=3377108 RepID=UPI003B846013